MAEKKKSYDATRLQRGNRVIKVPVVVDDALAEGVEQQLRDGWPGPGEPETPTARGVLDMIVKNAADAALDEYRRKGKRARLEAVEAEVARLKKELGPEPGIVAPIGEEILEVGGLAAGIAARKGRDDAGA